MGHNAAMNTWFRAIERATTEDEVVAQTRDFCSLLHPRDLAGLPEDVRAIRIEGRDDIPRLRERLEACGAVARARAFDAEKVGDLLAYLSRASARLGEIGRPH
jgi:hypothetical protein